MLTRSLCLAVATLALALSPGVASAKEAKKAAKKPPSLRVAVEQVKEWVGTKSGIFSPRRTLVLKTGKVSFSEQTTKDDGKTWRTVNLKGTYALEGNDKLKLTLEKPYSGKKAFVGALQPDGALQIEGIGRFMDRSKVSDPGDQT